MRTFLETLPHQPGHAVELPHPDRAASVADAHRPYGSVLAMALFGSLLMWLAQPPLGWWYLAWIAPVPWLMLARLKRAPASGDEELTQPRKNFLIRTLRSPTRLPSSFYGALWIAGFAYWLAAIYWLCLPHWATSFGWLALSFYLAFYLPVFVGLTRVGIHQLNLPIVLVAPAVWAGLELARGYIFTGFLMGALGHTQYRWTELIQISDLAGSYGVDFLVMFVAACIARMLPLSTIISPAGKFANVQASKRSITYWPLLPLAAAMTAVLAYGYIRTSGEYTRPGPKVALIQGSIDTTMKADPQHAHRVFQQYYDLSRQAVAAQDDIDLVVWPETMFRLPLVSYDENLQRPADLEISVDVMKKRLREHDEYCRAEIESLARSLRTSLLLGIDIQHYRDDTVDRYNAAAFVDEQGRVLGQPYSKMHRVAFGEYVPFAYYFPWLYRLTPLASGLTAGKKPECQEVAGARFSPNICYESVIPHLVRKHVFTLRQQGQDPDVLVNLTNDGWFWGSSELDMHLACGVFRAVECRKPFLIAANTGFSAWIDGDGRILDQGPRRATGFIIADVALDGRDSLYMRYGDWFAGLCLAACAGLAIAGVRNARRRG